MLIKRALRVLFQLRSSLLAFFQRQIKSNFHMSKIYHEIAHLSQATGAWLAHMSDAYCSLESWGRGPEGGGNIVSGGVEREGVNSLAWSGNIWCCDVILWRGGEDACSIMYNVLCVAHGAGI
jgi:hypothetical protein